MPTDVHYKLVRLLEAHPGISQREAARALGISLGKVNYCLHALVRRGWVKVSNFKNSNNKAAYLYVITPRGLRAKAALTLVYLQERVREYEALKLEIEEMRREAHRAVQD
jgi:EPS-associated MarR family transcriptional regulator